MVIDSSVKRSFSKVPPPKALPHSVYKSSAGEHEHLGVPLHHWGVPPSHEGTILLFWSKPFFNIMMTGAWVGAYCEHFQWQWKSCFSRSKSLFTIFLQFISEGRGGNNRRFLNLYIAKIGYHPQFWHTGGFGDKKCVNATVNKKRIDQHILEDQNDFWGNVH